jgi:hypothetical protein
LVTAATGAALLNLAVLATFGWSELMSPRWARPLWVALGAGWVASAVLSLAGSRRPGAKGIAEDPPGGFEKALDHYLKGDWFQAERLWVSLLRVRSQDIDARLMLATLLRHTGRLDEAATQLDRLTCLEGIGKWQWEVRRERELLARAKEQIDGRAREQLDRDSADAPGQATRAA